MSKGRAVGSDRRWNCGSTPSGVLGCRYPACAKAGERARANSFAMTLWARSILFPAQPFLSPPSSSCLLPPPSSSSSSSLLLLLQPPHSFPPFPNFSLSLLLLPSHHYESKVWTGCHRGGPLAIGIACDSRPSRNRWLKHTHTHTLQYFAPDRIASPPPGLPSPTLPSLFSVPCPP